MKSSPCWRVNPIGLIRSQYELGMVSFRFKFVAAQMIKMEPAFVESVRGAARRTFPLFNYHVAMSKAPTTENMPPGKKPVGQVVLAADRPKQTKAEDFQDQVDAK